jgi:hypothetical protein
MLQCCSLLQAASRTRLDRHPYLPCLLRLRGRARPSHLFTPPPPRPARYEACSAPISRRRGARRPPRTAPPASTRGPPSGPPCRSGASWSRKQKWKAVNHISRLERLDQFLSTWVSWVQPAPPYLARRVLHRRHHVPLCARAHKLGALLHWGGVRGVRVWSGAFIIIAPCGTRPKRRRRVS